MITHISVKQQENIIAFQPLQLQTIVHNESVPRQWDC